MNRRASPMLNAESLVRSKSLLKTRDRIQRQLAAVQELTTHNAEYLEPYEIAWIDHIIVEAKAINNSDALAMSNLSLLEKPASLRGGFSLPNLRTPSIGSAHYSPKGVNEDAQVMLAVSKNLNAASNLLSCCFERWTWLQQTRAQERGSQSNSVHLRELLVRRNHNRKTSASEATLSKGTEDIKRRDTRSSSSTEVASPASIGSDSSLCLLVDDTVEKWRQNAEDALHQASMRLKPVAGNKIEIDDASSVFEFVQQKPPQFVASTGTSLQMYEQSPYSSNTASSLAQDESAGRVLGPIYERSLHNTSFDKEPVDETAMDEQKQQILPPSQPQDVYTRGLFDFNDTQLPDSLCRQQSSLTTVPDSDAVATNANNASTLSFTSQTTVFDQKKSSRGRRWLEHQYSNSLRS